MWRDALEPGYPTVPASVIHPIVPVSGALPIVLTGTYRHYRETAICTPIGVRQHFASQNRLVKNYRKRVAGVMGSLQR